MTVSIFDADNHLYENRDSLTKYLPKQYKGIVDYVEVRGRTKIMVNGVVSNYIPNPTFDVVAKPGAQEDYFRNGNPEGKSNREILGEPMRCIDAFRGPEARLALMDEQGLQCSLMFPTLASLVEERLRDEPDLIHVVIHALNEWLYETWRFNYQDRIFTTPVITLPIVEKALEELDWVIERGAKCVLIRPAPVPGYQGPRSFALPEFDPVWQKVVDNDLLVAMHASDSGYSRYYSEWLGRAQEHLPFQPQAFPMLHSWRPVTDAASAFICQGALNRFPDLKVAFVENGSSWVAPLLTELKTVYKKMPQAFDFVDPVEQFRRNIYISPFWEDDFMELAGLIGEDHVLFGSDYPHPEGLAEPATHTDKLLGQGVPDDLVVKFMGGNLATLMGYES